MTKFDEHPTVRWWRDRSSIQPSAGTNHLLLNANSLREMCLEAGADDVGFVEIDRPAIADQHQDILTAFPRTKTLISFVCRMNRDNVLSPARSIANTEFHASGEEIDSLLETLRERVGRQVVERLTQIGIRALNLSVAFPQEMDRFPGKV